MKGVPYKQATHYADGVYGPDDLAAIWNACVNAHKALAQQSAPSAPVGVEGVIAEMRAWVRAAEVADAGPYPQAWRTVVVQEFIAKLEAALAQQGGEVHELRLCESSRLFLRPDRLYRFTVDPDCSMCREAASYYAQKGGAA